MDKQGKSGITTIKGSTLPFGATVVDGGINFAITLGNVEKCTLNLYHRNTGKIVASIPLDEKYKTGNVFSVRIEPTSKLENSKLEFIETYKSEFIENSKTEFIKKNNLECKENSYQNEIFPELNMNLFDNLENISYSYHVNGKEVIDPYAKIIYGRESFGLCLTTEEKQKIRGGILTTDFDWQNDKLLQIPYSKLIIYKMNVRSFTKHESSNVKGKGTFSGIIEKLPYLKELGINCVQVMPIYDFNEIIELSPNSEYYRYIDFKKINERYQTKNKTSDKNYKINLWGYCEDNRYFAPKASFSSDPYYAVEELKTLIRTFHQNGMEFIMEMHFPYGTNPNLIQDCLRYWVAEYHVDGFKLTGEALPSILLATDPILSTTKLLATGWDISYIYGKDYAPTYKNLAEYNDVYSVIAKRLLKSDENQVKSFADRYKYNPGKSGVINYITNQDGFTLMDLYSYDIKHNEENGEKNADGMEYNYSWNCGEEGKSKKKKVNELRRKQIRNAFTTLFFSQGTPLLYAGDEFGNSQQGNNNAYCQDNEISWLNWNDLNEHNDIFQYVKTLIEFRKQHPILHMEQPLKNIDYLSCGFPDLSYHGTLVWYPDYTNYSRILGILLSGSYAKINRMENDNNFYIAYNMHWENHMFDLPNLPKGMQWHVVLDTNEVAMKEEGECTPLKNQQQYKIAARTIVIFIGK